MEKKRVRRKSPKSTAATKKTTVVIPVDLDAKIYRLAEHYKLGISDMYAMLLAVGIDALAARAMRDPGS